MEAINHHKQSELYVFCAATRQELLKILEILEKDLDSHNDDLLDVSNVLSSSINGAGECLSIVCSSLDDLRKKVAYTVKKLSATDCRRIYERSGIYYFAEKLAHKGTIAFLFPGEGSQYQNMLAELSLYFPEIRRSFDIADAACSAVDGFLPSQYIFPTNNGRGQLEETLWKMETAVQSVLAANYAMVTLLKKLKINPDCLVGHSSGEFTALEQAQVIQFKAEKERIDFIRDGYVLVKELSAQKDIPEGVLVTVGGVKRREIESAIKNISSPIFFAMENCFHQYVLCGSRVSIEIIVPLLTKEGAICTTLPFNRPYHTSWFEQALKPLKDFFDRQNVFAPKIEIYSCATAATYPSDPEKIRSIAVQQWAMPVRFQETIETVYDRGTRVFIEAGPRGNLTGFVDNILKDKPHIAIPLDKIHRPGIAQLNHALGLLAANGVAMELDYFYSRRPLVLLDQKTLRDAENKKTALSARLPEMRLRAGSGEKFHFSISENRQNIIVPVAAHEVTVSDKENDPSPEVLDAYFQTMGNFVAVHGDIMRAYLETEGSEKQIMQKEATTSLTTHEFPLLGIISELKPGESLVSTREFDVDEDVYLQHHTLGTQISTFQPELKALPLMPLTVSMEMLAEAALALVPNGILIGMKDIVATKWIAFEEKKVALQISAKRRISPDFDEVDVEIREVNNSNDEMRTFWAPIVKGTMVLGDVYPSTQKAKPTSSRNKLDYNFLSSEVYPKRLFHGPLLQGVDSVTHWEEDGLEGMLIISSPQGLFRSNPDPQFVTDPVLLDAMGQVMGIWAAKEPWNGFVLFPFHVKAIQFFKPNLPPGEKVKFQLRIISTNETRIVANIDLVGKDNDLLVSIEGWEDRIFYITKPLHRFFLQPIKYTLSSPLVHLEEQLSRKGIFKFCILEELSDGIFQRYHKIWEKMLTCLILNQEEKRIWYLMGGSEKFRIQYLLGRAAAKDAVRRYLDTHHGLRLGPADVNIENDKKGKPFATGLWMDRVSEVPAISISHTGMVVVAAAGTGPSRGIGIDVENRNNLNDTLLEAAFSEDERRLTASFGSNTLEWIARFWCAKEAFCKAIGSGMIFNPKDIVVKEFDIKVGRLIMEARGDWTKEFPFLEGRRVEAYTFSRGKLAMAVCLF